ncbi:hypothetical protein FRB90_010555 [Tulasnella sp. 427]|nr:hypothetical protein FRB90_010555 [Tulasnella sp. 427]
MSSPMSLSFSPPPHTNDALVDITPPITPLKSRRRQHPGGKSVELTPINVGLAQNHFKDAWAPMRVPSLSPPVMDSIDSSFDSLDTPPLSAVSSSSTGTGGGLTTPLDAVHPLFGRMSLEEEGLLGRVGMFGEAFNARDEEEEDVFSSMRMGPAKGLLFLNPAPTSSSTTFTSPMIVPPTPLLSSSSSTFSPPPDPFAFPDIQVDTAPYSYAPSTDSINFFNPSPPPASSQASPRTPKRPRTSSSSPGKTPKAKEIGKKVKHRARRSGQGKARALGADAPGDATSSSRPKGKGKAKVKVEVEKPTRSPFVEPDHTTASRRAALQPAPELFTSEFGFKTVTLSKPLYCASPTSSPVRGEGGRQLRKRVPLGLSSLMNVENKAAGTCAGRMSSSGASTSSQNHRQNASGSSNLTCNCFIQHQARCEFLSWMPAQPPAPNAVAQAASIILRSAAEQNLCQPSNPHPLGDDCTFCQYERRVKTLRVAIAALSHHFDHLIARTSRERNQSTAVSNLPVELLSYILSLACADPSRPRMPEVVRFRGVSTYFRDAVDASGAFWTDVRVGHPLAEVALVRSRGCLIDVSMPRRDGLRMSAFMTDRDPMWQTVAANSGRWRSVKFVGRPTPVEIAVLLSPAPELRDVCLDFHSTTWGSPRDGQPRVDPGEGKPLRHVILNGGRMPWSSERFTHLRTLQLYNVEQPPSHTDFYRMLTSSHGLERLVLVALSWTGLPETHRQHDPLLEPVTFPNLEEITLFDIHSDLVQFLCSFISAPNARALSLESAPIEILSLERAEWRGFHETIQGCFHHLTHLEIELDCDRGVIDVRSNRLIGDDVPHADSASSWPPPPPDSTASTPHRFAVECYTPDVLLSFAHLAEFLADKGGGVEFDVSVIRSDEDPDEDEVDALLRGLTALRGIVGLDIAYFAGGAKVVRHLSTVQEVDVGAPPAWVCPWLTKLNVENVPHIWEEDWNAFLKVRGPRRVALQDDLEPPMRITDLQENVEDMLNMTQGQLDEEDWPSDI